MRESEEADFREPRMGSLSLRVWVLENVDRPYDQAGREEGKEEEMEGMKERSPFF